MVQLALIDMKTFLLYIFFILGINESPFAQSEGQYKLEIDLNDPSKKGIGFLRYFTEKGMYLDSAYFNDGKFSFSGKVPQKLITARIYFLTERDKQQKAENSCTVLLEPVIIKIKAAKELMDAQYSGSDVQKQYSELQKNLLTIKKKEIVLNNTYEKAETEKNTVLKDKLVNEEYPALFKEKQKILGAFIIKYPSSLVSADQFDDFAGDGEMNLTIVEPVYAILDNELKELPIVEKVAQRIAINKKTAPGMQAIDFSQTDTSGNLLHLSSFKGKYVLIDFWAGWCIPCRAENPLLLKLYALYHDKGFNILGVSLDGERKAWTRAIINDKLVWPQVSDLQIFDNAVAKQYGITSIPQNLLIGPDGKIIAKNLRGNKLENTLATIFK